jgi:hypothetical protein
LASQYHKKGKTVILFFARSPGPEAEEKKIFNSSKRNKSLFSILNNTIHRQLKLSGFDVIFWGENRQRGEKFADRFTHAFECIFELGYSSIISVGNDTPDLNLTDITIANNALIKGNKLVLGPSKDGGVYLIGLSQDLFEPSLFSAISWQTEHVFDQLSDLYEPVLLETKIDLDNLNGLFNFLNVNPGITSLVKRIKDLIVSSPYSKKYSDIPCSLLTSFTFHSRPPPFSL